MSRPGRAAGVPVICVGNPTLGGAGKTPAAIAVAQMLAAAGRRPFLLSRGYGGALAGPVRVDPARHRSADVGDEPLLLARFAPTVVARDRAAGADAARAAGADSIVMDDGFQNPGLHKNRSILVVDRRRGIGNGMVFPAGPLRVPLESQLRRAQALLLVGAGTAGDAVAARAQAQGLPVFHGRLEPDAQALAALQGRRVLAFAGIGDPGKFFATLREAGIDVGAEVSFPDHHRYRRIEARDLIERAEREGLILVTTEKDMARLAGQDDLAALTAVARGLPVTLKVAESGAFQSWVTT
jgi:tetraacyldisaccharide 4'-kinase